MNADDPLAYFITWTVYGSHLQGDEDGWHRRGKGAQESRPALAAWRDGRLKNPVVLMSSIQREAIEQECRRLSNYRGWSIWALNARSSHCHIVVTAKNLSGLKVRDQIKANCTRVLRERWPAFRDRPIWTVGGDWKCINDESALETVCVYVRDAQDRKMRDS